MKKLIVLLAAGLLVCGLVGGALADYTYTFPNHTYVHTKTSNGGGWGAWVDAIPAGNDSVFQSFGADLTLNSGSYTLTIYTNLPSTGHTVGSVTAAFADIFFSDGSYSGAIGTWKYVFDVSTGKIYQINDRANFDTSFDIWESRQTYYYGGEFDPTFTKDPSYPNSYNSNAPVPTQYVGNGTELGNLTISWDQTSTKEGTYQHTFTWNQSSFNPYAIGGIWIHGTGDCANDAVGGKVPIPGALLLFGLARLAAHRRQEEDELD